MAMPSWPVASKWVEGFNEPRCAKAARNGAFLAPHPLASWIDDGTPASLHAASGPTRAPPPHPTHTVPCMAAPTPLPCATGGKWMLHTSSSTGKRYWFNDATKASVWHDDALPPGWGVTYAGKGAPPEFVNLAAGTKVLTRPTEAAVPPAPLVPPVLTSSEAVSHPPPAKRARYDGAGGGSASAACSSGASSSMPAPAAVQRATLPIERIRSAVVRDKPDDRPGLPVRFNETWFGAPHKLVVAQVMEQLKRDAIARAEYDRKHRGVVESRDIVVLDIGAGTGAATRHFLECGASTATTTAKARGGAGGGLGDADVGGGGGVEEEEAPYSLSVFGIDIWTAGGDYYLQSLKEVGAPPAMLAAAEAEAQVDGYAQYSANFWDELNVTPMRTADVDGVRDLLPTLSTRLAAYIDADPHYAHLKRLLTLVVDGLKRKNPPRDPDAFPAFLLGGGWSMSDGVRQAVMEVSREASLVLHVEMNECWVLSQRRVITVSHNAAAGVVTLMSEAAAAKMVVEAAAMQVTDAAVVEVSTRREWLKAVIAAIEADMPRDALTKLLGEDAGRISPDNGLPWIDCGDEGKWHYTPLMHAARHGRNDAMVALLTAGAKPNVQAERNYSTALHLAAHDGHEATVQLLLQLGADPTAMNRYMETPATAARNRNRDALAALLSKAQATTVAGWTDVPTHLRSPPPDPPPTPIKLRNGLAVLIRPVTEVDTAAVRYLYRTCQAEYGRDATVAGAVTEWTKHVMDVDFKNPAQYYAAIPRSRLWVMTCSREAFARLTGGLPSHELHTGSTRGDVVIGLVGVVPHMRTAPGLKPAMLATTAELQRLATHPDLRRCGIASALVTHVEGWARWAGYDKVWLQTQGFMVYARSLYTKLGYTVVGPPEGVPKSFYKSTIITFEYEKVLGAGGGGGSGTTGGAAVAP